MSPRELLHFAMLDRTDDNQNWQVSYTIVVREGGWSELVVHEDPYFPGHPLPLAGLSAPEIAAATFNATRALQVDWSGLNITLA